MEWLFFGLLISFAVISVITGVIFRRNNKDFDKKIELLNQQQVQTDDTWLSRN